MESFDGRRRVIVEGVSPEVDDGRFPAKRVEGETVLIGADVFADGHDVIGAVAFHRHQSEKKWREVRMRPLINDRWQCEITVERLGFHLFTIEGWIDHFLTWHRDMHKRVEARQSDLDVQLTIGLQLIRAAIARAKARDRRRLESFATFLQSDAELEEKIEEVWSEDLLALMWRNADRSLATRYRREVLIQVDRRKAAYSSWYELFPRSFGTFRDVERQLPRIAKMGFDVLYLPPVHPIGRTFRKGRNNKVDAEPGDVGSPWAIGGSEGGHKAIHPELGTMSDLQSLAGAAQRHGIELALDMAFQASPDHPYMIFPLVVVGR